MINEQWRLRLSGILLVVIGLGNNVLPAAIQRIAGVDYLVVAIASLCAIVAIRFKRSTVQPIAFVTVVGFLTIVAIGITSISVEGYTAAKLSGFLIALVLIVIPQLLPETSELRSSAITTMIVLTGITSVALLMVGEYTLSGRVSVWNMSPIGVARSGGVLASVGIAITLWPKVGMKGRFAGTVMVAVGLFAAALTGTRGPLLGFAGAALITLLILMRVRQISWTGLFIICGGIVSGIALAADRGVLNMSRLTSTDTSGRQELWEKTTQVIYEHPVGIGWGRLPEYLGGFAAEEGGGLYPHNVFLEIAVEGGIVGLGIFVLIILWVMLRGYFAIDKSANWRDSIPLNLLVFSLVNAMFSSDLIGNRLMWLGVGICLASITDHDRGKVTPFKAGTVSTKPRW